MNNVKQFQRGRRFLFLGLCCLAIASTTYGGTIADYTVAKENILRSIPRQYIDNARNNLHIAVQGTSHSTHILRGMFGLDNYKPGDNVLFGVSPYLRLNDNKLSYRDDAIRPFASSNGLPRAESLDQNEGNFVAATRAFLDDPSNADINVLAWVWCRIENKNINTYLNGMQALINEYGPGGSKIGSGAGKRETPVTFIFMTGHAWPGRNVGAGQPEDQARKIVNYARNKGYFCLDFYSIETHDMNGNYWQDAGLAWSPDESDDYSASYGGYFDKDWQNSHTEGVDWFKSRDKWTDNVKYGAHLTNYVTSNKLAYGLWWILARISGWDPEGGSGSTTPPSSSNSSPSVDAGRNQTITLPDDNAWLNGTVTDPDDNPDVQWSKASGPGSVSFDNPNTEDTTATFSAPGRYVLKLQADDGENPVVSDTVTITVRNDDNSGSPASITDNFSNNTYSNYRMISGDLDIYNGKAHGELWRLTHAYHSTSIGSANQRVEANVFYAGRSLSAGLTARVNPSAKTGYTAYFERGSVHLCSFHGSSVRFISRYSGNYRGGTTYKLRLETQGNQIKVFVNNRLVINKTNNQYRNGNYAGLRFRNTNVNLTLDNFRAGKM